MRKILIAEDNYISSFLLEESINKKKFIIKSVYDGQSVIDSYLVFKPDLVILDIVMPTLSGFDILSEIKKINKDASIIVISSLPEEYGKTKSINLGAKYYLEKPIIPEMVKNIIDMEFEYIN